MIDGKEWKASNAMKSTSPKTPKPRKNNGSTASSRVSDVKVKREEE